MTTSSEQATGQAPGRPGQEMEETGRRRAPGGTDGAGTPDVLLDVPDLEVEEISLEVRDLHARIALEARLAELVQLHVGADVDISDVVLEIKGVKAEAHLVARLDNVVTIIDRALATVDAHPEILAELSRAAIRIDEGVRDATGRLVRAGEAVGEGVGRLGEGAGGLGQGSGEPGAAPAAGRVAGESVEEVTVEEVTREEQGPGDGNGAEEATSGSRPRSGQARRRTTSSRSRRTKARP